LLNSLFVAPVRVAERRHEGEAGTLSVWPLRWNEVFVTKKAGMAIWRDTRIGVTRTRI
jgi:hypothetical protein